MLISTTNMASMENVSSQTIRRWIKEGKYETTRTKGGHFRIKLNQTRRICYARISSRKQKTSIDTQKQILLGRYPNSEFKSDVASAFNFKRKGIKAILELAMQGTPIHLVATTQDRIARSGFQLIKWIIELHGGRIEVLEEDNNTETFNTNELIGFITSFCNSYYGKRSSSRRKDTNCIKENKILSRKRKCI
jgi:excisionase family DNA binding protein